jgi:NADPH-dependent glutamate synthase beta subunit-like oxidoreductase
MEQRELRQLEEMCIQEHAPACTAACPIHVDVRAVLADASRGDFEAALKTLKKRQPFPGIIGRICDQPCQAVCKRAEVGETISVAALERACADLGASTADKIPRTPRRSQRVAVLGGGLSGLTAAYDLARKGYSVVIFEAGARLGGRLWTFPTEVLPSAVLQDEVGQVERLGVEVRLNATVGPALPLAELQAEYDAVYLGVGVHPPDTFSLALNEHGGLAVDPVTFATGQAGVFAGGSLLQTEVGYSPIQSISSGRRAAISIDRYCQKVSLTAARHNEGAYDTRLYTSIVGLEPLPAVPISDPQAGYSRAEAIQEARRCLQCKCLECVKVCPYLAHFGNYPKKYVREVYNNLSIVMGTRHANKLINSCSLCGLCLEVCPENLDMGAVCLNARQTMVAQDRMPPSAHDFALRDMQFSNSEKFTLARHQPGATSSDFLFFPGCQLSASAPEQVEQIYAYLRDTLTDGAGVGLMLRCCGAPANWAGRTDLFQTVLADFKRQYHHLDSPRVILACSSCYQIFKAHLPEVKIVSLWELFDEFDLPPHRPIDQATHQPTDRVSIHDPCTTRYEAHVQDSVRNILQRLGYQIEELPLSREKTECCSYGGLMWLANPELAQVVVKQRVQASPLDYVTYCAMCRDFFAAQGKPTWHLLDLIFDGATGTRSIRKGPGYSQRHENRVRLKRKLLKDIWGEAMDEHQPHETIPLILSEAVQERLEARLILVEDIQQVLDYAESTGNKLLNQQTGHFLAYYTPSSVTYWVEYSPADQGDGFVIHNAYSHRMEIVKNK